MSIMLVLFHQINCMVKKYFSLRLQLKFIIIIYQGSYNLSSKIVVLSTHILSLILIDFRFIGNNVVIRTKFKESNP